MEVDTQRPGEERQGTSLGLAFEEQYCPGEEDLCRARPELPVENRALPRSEEGRTSIGGIIGGDLSGYAARASSAEQGDAVSCALPSDGGRMGGHEHLSIQAGKYGSHGASGVRMKVGLR